MSHREFHLWPRGWKVRLHDHVQRCLARVVEHQPRVTDRRDRALRARNRDDFLLATGDHVVVESLADSQRPGDIDVDELGIGAVLQVAELLAK